MKIKKGILYLSFLVGIVFFLTAQQTPKVINGEKEALLIQTVLRDIEHMHFDPKDIDDDFSQNVFDTYIENIFRNGRFITQEDIDGLIQYETMIDDELLSGKLNFFNATTDLLLRNLDKTEALYKNILSQPLDFNIKEDFISDPDKRAIPKNDEELKELWRKQLKWETLDRLTNKIKDQEKAKEKGDKEVEDKSREELEKEARAETLEQYDKWYSRLHKLKREDRLSYYLNTIVNLFDPHTSYYKPIDKENFNINFSGRLEGIGARLQTDGDFTKVSDIIVGGPAWKGKELEKKDIITSVAQEGEEPVDIRGMLINDVVQLIRGKKDSKVTLTVKKIDGTVKDIVIIRDIVIIDERFAKSLILDGASENEKIGYISLPSFYADFENEDGRRCSDDIKKELEKLKSANVDGIILDLRNNGGGSLRDVVDISGYFIERGPIVQVKSRGEKPRVLRDNNQSVLYDGPLIVMVNELSASASEILAAALQDYNRAIIVGSQHTFGKGTVQRFIDLDRTVIGYEEVKPLGDLKLTMQKFYRINGGSTQLKGVTSDIILPGNYQYLPTGEREYDSALEWTQIAPVEYKQNVMDINNLALIQQRSNERIKNNGVFQKIDQHALYIKDQRDDSSVALDFSSYMADEKAIDEEAKAYKDLFKEPVLTGINNHAQDMPAIEKDESKVARNDEWKKTVAKDVYIKESVNIMHDLISLNQ